jgi:hypothetical protein
VAQAVLDGADRHAAFKGDADARQCVEHVVAAGQVEAHVEIQVAGFAAVGDFETHLCAGGFDVVGAQVGVFVVDGVGGVGAADFRQDGADVGAVAAQKGFAVEGNAVDEVDKGLV